MSTTMAPPKRPEIKTSLPGPKGQEIIAADAQFVNPSYPRPSFKLVAERAQGVWVEDVDGNIFLDCNAGVAVCSTGHCHPEVVRAIQEQAAKLIHMCGTDYYYRLMPDLAKKLDEIVPVKSPTRTHFANSGTEAVETALKLAMHVTGREKFIAFFNSFHGRTLGSLSLTSSRAAQRLGFKRQALDVVHVPYPNEFRNPFRAEDCGDGGAGAGALNWIEERLFKTTTPPEEVAGIVVEAVQGEGGYVPAPKDFLKGLRRICDEHGILLIVDEVQSGMGRTGKMFASDHYGVQPDIVTIAKGIGSGLPIGACVARADLMDWKPGAHASTFGGNPVCIASALKTIELLERELVQNSNDVGAYLKAGLEKLQTKYDCIGDVRGMGLMLGVEFVTDRASNTASPELRDRIEMACFERGLIILGAGENTIRWSPPLILTKENVDVALEIFDDAIAASISEMGLPDPDSIRSNEPVVGLQQEFYRLAEEWRRETRHLSSDSDIAGKFAYQQIIGMGEKVLPLIFRELAERGGQWYWALRAISRQDPVRTEDRGNVRRMTETWLNWGRQQGYVQ